VESIVVGLRAAADGMVTLVSGEGLWMTWNLLLAIVPAVFAIVLFRRGSTRTVAWWVGVAVFVLFLPNAPYVLTDAIHLFDQIRATDSDLQVIGIVIPVYGGFFLAGFGCYVIAVRRVRDYVRHDVRPFERWRLDLRWLAIAAALHASCALGIFLGRVLRLNSWNVVTHPASVLDALRVTLQGFPIAVVVATFVGLVGLTAFANLVVDAGVERGRRLLDGHR
jgi:uncharacterized membrane protein